jgi:anti-sigma B factor antagonist
VNDFEMARNGTQCRVTPGGKLTAAETPALQEALKKEIAAGAREIVFDLGAVQTLDSTGIGLLVAASNSMAGVKGAVRLTGVSPDIMKLLRSMRLTERLNAAEKEASHG